MSPGWKVDRLKLEGWQVGGLRSPHVQIYLSLLIQTTAVLASAVTNGHLLHARNVLQEAKRGTSPLNNTHILFAQNRDLKLNFCPLVQIGTGRICVSSPHCLCNPPKQPKHIFLRTNLI